ncbi:uncharacterized protein LOC141914448 isoform X1 [Tubulanus polymorphus]|uniref:uncharacterized protein LOC141914448 isoform X1 n=2 Tax=Tubulanus polymorphus TaxID=672921 RepID=UPI003DA3A96A
MFIKFSEIEMEDQDTHMCLTCHATIIGLDNYISHKKVGCVKDSAAKNDRKKNDDKKPVDVQSDIPVVLCDNLDEGSSDACLPAEEEGTFTDFLMSLDLQHKSSIKEDTTKTSTKKETDFSKSLAVCLSSITSDTNLPITNLLTNLAFDSDSELENLSEFEFSSEGEDDFDDDDVGNSNYPPHTYTGGKWKPGSHPPRAHTGGKWKPGMSLRASSGKIPAETDEDDNVDDDDEGDDEVVLEEVAQTYDAEESATKRQSETVKKKARQFFCSVCNRTMCSERSMGAHLVSQYHTNRAVMKKQENEKLFQTYDYLIQVTKPFRCMICTSFSNHSIEFTTHLQSKQHVDNASKLIGPQMCTVCQFQTKNNDEMLAHVQTDAHINAVTSKKRCVIIRERRKDVACSMCRLKLHSVTQLKRHLLSKHSHVRMMLLNAQRQNVCIPCGGKKFSSRSSLAIHMRRRHTKERPYKCIYCKKSYCDKFTLKIHEKTKKHISKTAAVLSLRKLYRGDENEPVEAEDNEEQVEADTSTRPNTLTKHKCPYCNFITPKYSNLRPHLLTSHVDISEKCDVCDILLFGKKEIDAHSNSRGHKHLLECIQRNGKLYVCETCGKKLGSKQQYMMHNLSHESQIYETATIDTGSKYEEFIANLPKGSATKCTCPECGKTMAKVNIIPHLRSHEKRKPFSCLFCAKTFSSAASLRRHLEIHLGLTHLICEDCGKTFSKAWTLKCHQDLVHKKVPRTKQCTKCDAKFIHVWQLNHHMKIHSMKELECPYEGCELRFRAVSDLTIHQRVHTNERPFLCDQCCYAGKSQNQLTRHMRTHTGERKYSCQFCPYKAQNSTHLQRHMRIHIGSKPFKCPYCTFACNTHENLRKHILNTRKHAGMKIYPCQIKDCSYGTNDAKELKKHLLSEHSNDVKNKDLNAMSVFAGLYERDSDLKSPPEGARIIPIKEKRKASGESDVKSSKKKCNRNNFNESVQDTGRIDHVVETHIKQMFPEESPSELVILSIDPKTRKMKVDATTCTTPIPETVYEQMTVEYTDVDHSTSQYILTTEQSTSDDKTGIVSFRDQSSILTSSGDILNQPSISMQSIHGYPIQFSSAIPTPVLEAQKSNLEFQDNVNSEACIPVPVNDITVSSSPPIAPADVLEIYVSANGQAHLKQFTNSQQQIGQVSNIQNSGLSGRGDTLQQITESLQLGDMSRQESMAIELLTQLSAGQYGINE